MKKHFLLFFALIAASFSFNFRSAALEAEATESLSNYEIQRIFSSYNRMENIGTIQLRSLQQGRNHLLTDLKTGRKLMLVAERKGDRVRIAGFMIQEKDGRYFRLPDTHTGQASPGDSFGCPDNWNAKIICYTHPTYKVKVCYLRCTPTEITLQFPSGF